MTKPEFTIEQIRKFAQKGYRSIAARYVQSAVLHIENCVQLRQLADDFMKAELRSASHKSTCEICDDMGNECKEFADIYMAEMDARAAFWNFLRPSRHSQPQT